MVLARATSSKACMAVGATLEDPASPLGKQGPSPGQWLEAVSLAGAVKGLDVACCFPTNSSSHSGRLRKNGRMGSGVLCVSEQAIVESETILYHLQVCRWPWRPGPPLTCCAALDRLHTSSSCSCYGCCRSHRHSHGHGHCGCPAGKTEPGAKPIWSGEAPQVPSMR